MTSSQNKISRGASLSISAIHQSIVWYKSTIDKQYAKLCFQMNKWSISVLLFYCFTVYIFHKISFCNYMYNEGNEPLNKYSVLMVDYFDYLTSVPLHVYKHSAIQLTKLQTNRPHVV